MDNKKVYTLNLFAYTDLETNKYNYKNTLRYERNFIRKLFRYASSS